MIIIEDLESSNVNKTTNKRIKKCNQQLYSGGSSEKKKKKNKQKEMKSFSFLRRIHSFNSFVELRFRYYIVRFKRKYRNDGIQNLT